MDHSYLQFRDPLDSDVVITVRVPPSSPSCGTGVVVATRRCISEAFPSQDHDVVVVRECPIPGTTDSVCDTLARNKLFHLLYTRYSERDSWATAQANSLLLAEYMRRGVAPTLVSRHQHHKPALVQAGRPRRLRRKVTWWLDDADAMLIDSLEGATFDAMDVEYA